jgi:glycosyltransferase involved in cell wall biosynthesis
MRDDISAKGIPKTRMTAVPMGVALDRMPYPFPISSVHKGNGERWLVYLGTLSSLRQPVLLVELLGRLRTWAPDVVLYLVGKGDVAEDESAILEHARRLDLGGRVRITGQLDQKRAWEYTAQADVCLSPYPDTPIHQSTSPTKLVEYLALGRPVVASLHPEQERVLSQSGAGVSVPLTARDFADAVGHLLDRPALAEEMGRRGRRWVEIHRSYVGIADLVESCFSRLLSHSTSG